MKIDWYFNKCHGVWTPPYSIAHINDRYSMKELSGNRLKTAHHLRLYANVRGSFVAIQNFLNLLWVWSLKCQLDTLDWRHLTVAQILQKKFWSSIFSVTKYFRRMCSAWKALKAASKMGIISLKFKSWGVQEFARLVQQKPSTWSMRIKCFNGKYILNSHIFHRVRSFYNFHCFDILGFITIH